MPPKENAYQGKLIKRLKARFPDCLVLKNDEQYLQGIPDLMVLNGDRWGALEVKRGDDEMKNPGPNQEHYVRLLDTMGFAAFICPSNEKEVLDALQRSFETERKSCSPDPEQSSVVELRRREV